MRNWPDDYDIRSEEIFRTRIRPFIDRQMEALAAFDRQRAAHVAAALPGYSMTYVFHEHAQRVAEDMRRAAQHMKLPGAAADNLYWAMLPHDIGKVRLPVDLWDMEAKPDEKMKALRRSHTEKGAGMVREELGDIRHPFIDLMLDIMLNHHEQMDGGGFRGLKAPELSLPVRLACIIESYDGYAIPRPHFGSRDISPEGVLKRMREEKGDALYDMELFDVFAELKLSPVIPAKAGTHTE